MNEYLKAQNKTNQIIIANNITSNELDRFSASDFRWADNRTKQFRHRQVKKGEIYQFEFGKNYDSVLKLNDIRTVSINRILYQQNGMIAPISNTYKQIEQLVLQKYFPSFYYDYNQFQQKAVLLEKQQMENDAALKELTSKNEELKEQIAA